MVTGSNGAIGEALVEALLDRGAAKVYAAAKRGASFSRPRRYAAGKVMPIQLSITDAAEVAAAVRRCPDVDVVINNAFVCPEPLSINCSLTEGFWEQVEVNCFGALGVCLAFAPVLASRGGGTIANLCSALTLTNLPHHDVYRLPLAARKVRVVRAYPADSTTATTTPAEGAVPTPEQLAEVVFAWLERGAQEIPLPWRPQGVTVPDKRSGAAQHSASEMDDLWTRVTRGGGL